MAIGYTWLDDDALSDTSHFKSFRWMGDWWLTSKSDPRFNLSGRACVGGFQMPEEAQAAVVELTERLGEPPEDLEFGYTKD